MHFVAAQVFGEGVATSLNLMVAITGVLLTITIQKFAMTPAEATNSARLRMVVVTSPEIAPVVSNAADAWEQTRDGAGFDVVVEPLDGTSALNRVRGRNGGVPDAWIPANSVWTKAGIGSTSTPEPIAQSPMVLIASADSAAPLLNMCGRDKGKIPSWGRLRSVLDSLNGGFGLPDPQGSSVGALARLSMASEWGSERNLSPTQAVKSPQFWKWMRTFEDKVPSGAFSSVSMVKGIAEGTSDRYKWVIGYESDAEGWKKAGKGNLKYFYLPRTIIADYPFTKVNNVRASIEVESGRDSFAKYLRSNKVQANLGNNGFRPTEVKTSSSLAKLGDLPREEKLKLSPVNTLTAAWARMMG